MCFVVCNSQNKNIDSLLNTLKTQKEDTNKVNTLTAISVVLNRNADYLKAEEYSNTSLNLAKKLNYKIGVIDATNSLGNIFQNQGNYPQALQQYYEVLKLSQDINYKKGIAFSLRGSGATFYLKGEYPKALNDYLKALEIFKISNNKKDLAFTYNNISLIYDEIGNYPKALDNLLISLRLSEEIGDKRGQNLTYNNIGNIYATQKNFSEALKYFEMSKNLSKTLTDKKQFASSLNNIGNIYFQTNSYEKALNNYLACLEIRKQIGDKKNIINVYHNIALVYDEKNIYSKANEYYLLAIKMAEDINTKFALPTIYNNLGILYLKQKKYSLAEECIEKGLKLSKEIDSKDDVMESYKALFRLDTSKGNFSLGLKHYLLFSQLEDSLINEENSNKIVQYQMQYEFDKQGETLKAEQLKKEAALEANNTKQKFVILSLSGSAIILLLIVLFVITQKRFQTEQRSMQLEQKLLRSQMNPHFIFNSLHAIQKFILKKDELQAASYLSSFAALTRDVLENSQLEYISLNQEIILLENYLKLQKLRFGNRFNYSINVSSDIDATSVNIPPMLAQPFIENAVEHGMKDVDSGGLIEINFKKVSNYLLFEIKDNGSGLQENAPDSEHCSMALQITKDRIALMNTKNSSKASLTIEDAYPLQDRKGLKVSFSIPV